MDYDSLLKRGKAEQAEAGYEKGRFRVPAVKVQIQGKKTIITNFNSICSAMNRAPADVAKYVLREIGTAGSHADGRLALSGAFGEQELNEVLKRYIESHIMCKVCHLPDTKLIKEDRKNFIQCEACGAKYPLK